MYFSNQWALCLPMVSSAMRSPLCGSCTEWHLNRFASSSALGFNRCSTLLVEVSLVFWRYGGLFSTGLLNLGASWPSWTPRLAYPCTELRLNSHWCRPGAGPFCQPQRLSVGRWTTPTASQCPSSSGSRHGSRHNLGTDTVWATPS
jgi:hypothetical protein